MERSFPFLDIEGQTVASIDLQSERTAVVGGSFDLDAGTGNLVGVISVCTYGEDGTPAKMSFYMVCLGETSSITLYYELIPEVPSINYGSTSMNPFEERSRFYQGSAFEITKYGKIYKVDVSGQRSELAAPFSYTASGPGIITGCRLLENYAVMNNNGYVYVIDKNGNTAFSEDEYEGAPFTSYAELGHQSGLVILKNSGWTDTGHRQLWEYYNPIRS